jgi:hypothetical protein
MEGTMIENGSFFLFSSSFEEKSRRFMGYLMMIYKEKMKPI